MPLLYRLLRAFGHQLWIPRGRDRVIRMFASPERVKPIPFSVDFFGKVYEGHLDNFIDWSVYFFGCFARSELSLLRYLADNLRASGQGQLAIFDIGANIGHHALFASTIADMVFAFEPFPEVLKSLNQKVSQNRLGNLIVHPVGLGTRDEDCDYYIPESENLGMGTFDSPPPNWTGQTIKLALRHGDSYFSNNALPVMNILKIDVEGFEKNVVDGLRDRILRDRPVIMMELSPRSRSQFGTEADFRAALYPDHTVFGVHNSYYAPYYRLAPQVYNEDFEILIVPNELLGALQFGRQQ